MSGMSWGVAGFGWVARDFGVPGILASGGTVAGVADPSPASRAAAAAAGLVVHAGLDGLLDDPSVEAVYVATPNDLHREVVERACRAGKAVLCEKPMACTLADAMAMADAVRAAGVVYGTAFDQRHHPAHARMRAGVADGEIGTVTAVRLVYACWLGRGWEKVGGAENWRADPARAGGGALMDLAPHGLDIVEYLLGEPVEDVSALIQHRVQDYAVDDGAMLVGRTGRGVLVSLHVAFNHPETLPRRRLEVIGTGGMLTAENTMGQDAGGTVVLRDASGGDARALPVDAGEPFERQMRAFAASVRGAVAGVFDVERDVRTMALISRAYACA